MLISDKYLHHNASCKESPRMVLFLIEQSREMMNSYGPESKSSFAIKLLEEIVNNLVQGRFCGNGIYNDLFLSVIGYGYGLNGDAEILTDGWLKEFFFDSFPFVFHSFRNDYGNCVINRVFSGAIDLCKEWIRTHNFTNRYNSDGFIYEIGCPTPLIVNITTGQYEDYYSLDNMCHNLHSLTTADGEPLLFNILLDNFDGRIIEYPHYLASESHYQRLLNISSFCPISIAETLNGNGEDITLNSDAKLFYANPREIDNVLKIIRYSTLWTDFMMNSVCNPYIGHIEFMGREFKEVLKDSFFAYTIDKG